MQRAVPTPSAAEIDREAINAEQERRREAARAAQLDAVMAEFRVFAANMAALQRRLTLTCVPLQHAGRLTGYASENGDGVRQACDAYACAEIDGRCFRDCVSTNDCAPGYACDMGARQCISTR